MERTQIYMTEDQKRELAVLSEKTGESQSVLIRRALDEFLEKKMLDRVKKQKEFWAANAGTWDGDEESGVFVERLRAGADARLNHLHGQMSEPESDGFHDGAPIKGGKAKAGKKTSKGAKR